MKDALPVTEEDYFLVLIFHDCDFIISSTEWKPKRVFFTFYFLVLWMHAGNNILETYTCNHFKILQKIMHFP